MTLFHRRVILIIFIIIFLIAAPAVILYTSGYRYNFQKGRVQKTGILMLSSVPRGAEIWLNGKKVESGTTPARLENILPGDYEIKFIKEGYHDWQKKLPVYENNTTFAEKVILWKQEKAQSLSTAAADSWLISQDQSQVAIISSTNTLEIIYVGGELADILTAKEAGIKTNYPLTGYDQAAVLSWSPDNKKILLSAKSQLDYYLVFNTENNSLQRVSGQFKIIKWGENSNQLYAQDKFGFWQIDLATSQQKLLFKSFQADDFILADDRIYYLKNQTLWGKNLADGRDEVVTSPLKCDSCQISKKVSGRFLLHRDSDQKILLIDPANRSSDVESTARKLYWLNDSSLLFYNDWEIYIYNFYKKDPELITRLGQPIKSAIWHPKGKHLIFSADNRINLIELDNRELRNLIDLSDNTEANDLAISRDGKILFFSGQNNGSPGVYKLILQ